MVEERTSTEQHTTVSRRTVQPLSPFGQACGFFSHPVSGSQVFCSSNPGSPPPVKSNRPGSSGSSAPLPPLLFSQLVLQLHRCSSAGWRYGGFCGWAVSPKRCRREVAMKARAHWRVRIPGLKCRLWDHGPSGTPGRKACLLLHRSPGMRGSGNSTPRRLPDLPPSLLISLSSPFECSSVSLSHSSSGTRRCLWSVSLSYPPACNNSSCTSGARPSFSASACSSGSFAGTENVFVPCFSSSETCPALAGFPLSKLYARQERALSRSHTFPEGESLALRAPKNLERWTERSITMIITFRVSRHGEETSPRRKC